MIMTSEMHAWVHMVVSVCICTLFRNFGRMQSGKIVLEQRPDLLQRAEPRICAFDIETTKLPLQFPNAEYDQVCVSSVSVPPMLTTLRLLCTVSGSHLVVLTSFNKLLSKCRASES